MIPQKIASIIPRLGTDHVGELVATRDALVRSLGAVGLDLHDLAAACVLPRAAPTSSTSNQRSSSASYVPSFGDMARACRDLDCGRLTLRERAFVADMVRKGFAYRPYPRQSSWLTDIFYRLNGRAAA